MPHPRFTLQAGKAIGQSISIYLRNFVPFTLLCALVLTPWIALTLLVPLAEDDFLGTFAHMLVLIVLTYLLTGALTYGIVQQLRGKPASMGDATARGMQSFFRVLGTGLLAGLRILIGFILLYVPGVIESIRLFVAIPAAVMEGKGAGDAVARSINLTQGSRWQIFTAWFVVAIVITIGLSVLVGFFIGFFFPEMTDFTWLQVAITVLTTPIQATVAAVIYFQLRQGKENVAVEELAAVFD